MTSTTGLLGYAQPWVVRAGEQVAFKVSSNGPACCDLVILRVICADINPEGPGAEYDELDWGRAQALAVAHQPVSTGSCAVAVSAPEVWTATGLELRVLIFPTLRTAAPQVVFSFGNLTLYVVPEGRLVARAGEAEVGCSGQLDLRQWYDVTLRIGDGRLSLTCDRLRPLQGMADRESVGAALVGEDWPGGASLPMFAAEPDEPFSGRPMTRHHFNGKIEAPRLSDASGRVLAAWDFHTGQGSARVADSGPEGHDLVLRNTPMRGATGHLWNGSVEHWELTPEHYAAIHFHDDDCTDCEWETTWEVTVPEGARSGFHVARLTDERIESDVSFFVSARAGAPTARVLFLVPTATYLAYANTNIKFDSANTENLYEAPTVISEDELYLNLHRELGLSLYDTHGDDSGVIYAGSRRPMLNARPGLYTFNYVNDTHVVKWLELRGYTYDIATDEDLHRDGLGLLESYDVVLTGSHPEYWSTPMWDALDAFQQGGGRHMYLGGNGFYWRIAWSAEHPEVIENRRGMSGVRTWEGEPGEHMLSFTGEPGGLWRSLGRAPQRLVGVGFSATLFVRSNWFRRRKVDAAGPWGFVFEGVKDAVIGDFGYRGGGCVGLEIDRWEGDLGSPGNAVILATSEGIDAGGLLSGEEFITTTRALDGTQNANVRADMVIFATPGGGAVWSTGSIAWATSLLWNGGNNSVSRVTANVLDRFLDPEPIGK